MENKNAIKLIEKIQKNLLQNKFNVSEIVEDLKKVREISMQENIPTVTKSLRLAYEHLEKNKAFLISIPADIEENETDSIEDISKFSDSNDIESLEYYLSLLTDLGKKNNILDIKAYNEAFLAF
ncbi:MAG: hypothetical protein IE891_01120 [Flavobacteriaceae bacterium]|nr:hypothetical protein [Flavobacteriaceae bacterium]